MKREQLKNMDDRSTSSSNERMEKKSSTSGSEGPEDEDEQKQECSICLLDIEPEVNCCVTNCSIPHAFHTSCLIEHAAQPRRRNGAISCPLCRVDLFMIPTRHSIELLRLVTRKEWDRMTEHLQANPDAKFDAVIERGDYDNNANCGMMPLHFAIRDHAPLVRIKQILEAYPAAKNTREISGHTPYDFLSEISTNGESWTEQEYTEVKDYLYP